MQDQKAMNAVAKKLVRELRRLHPTKAELRRRQRESDVLDQLLNELRLCDANHSPCQN